MLVDTATNELVVEVATGHDAAPHGARQPLHAGVAGRVAESGDPVLVTGEVRDDQVAGRLPRRRRGGSSVLAPMLVNDELIGIIALERESGVADFTQWELRAVSLFANHAATAVINAKRYESERENVSRLADMIERRSEFTATLVHDLKAPLTAILGYTTLLDARGEGLGAAGRREAVHRIEASSQDLLDMVNDVLRSASFEAAEPVRTEPVELDPFLHDLVESIQTMAAARDGQPRAVRVRAPEGVTVRSDPSALRSVLQNLLENAVKYSPAGSPVELHVHVRGEQLEFAVTDHGRGIPPEEQEVIFERFRRRRPGESADEGVGLGLYIVRSLVRAQGGDIEIDSVPGRGSTFRVTIPERHATNGDGRHAPPPPPPQPTSNGVHRRGAADAVPPPPPAPLASSDR
jgi:signal transduction histidine kinase